MYVEDLGKRTLGFKRRLKALKSAPHQVPVMLERALKAGCEATYVLMDSWYTHAPLIEEIRKLGLDVIGMVKNDNKRHLIGEHKVDLKKIYKLATNMIEGIKIVDNIMHIYSRKLD